MSKKKNKAYKNKADKEDFIVLKSGQSEVQVTRKKNGKIKLKNISNTPFKVSGTWNCNEVTENFIVKFTESGSIQEVDENSPNIKADFLIEAGKTRCLLPCNFEALLINISLNSNHVNLKK